LDIENAAPHFSPRKGLEGGVLLVEAVAGNVFFDGRQEGSGLDIVRKTKGRNDANKDCQESLDNEDPSAESQ
jgi:hypothetical protein